MVGGVQAVPGDVVGGQGVVVHKPKHGNLVQSPPVSLFYQHVKYGPATKRSIT